MKIGPVDSQGALPPVQLERELAAEAAAATQAPGAVSVEVSAAAAEALAATAGDFDAAKVAQVSQALRDGTYQINAERIADGLLASSAELLTPTPAKK